jgi:hypothetical protein
MERAPVGDSLYIYVPLLIHIVVVLPLAAALSKTVIVNWPIEKSSLQFRADFFKVLNHPQFANLDSNFTAPTFGVISSTAVNPRVIQLALKIAF